MVESDRGHRLGLDGPEEGSPEVDRGHAREQVGGQVDEALVEAGGAGEAASGVVGEHGQQPGGVLERLALDQAGEQQVSLLPERQLVVEVDVGILGQQAAGLQLDERRRDEQELRGHLEVEDLHALELGEVGVHDGGQGDLVELHLLAQDQVQEQVERPLEHLGLHLVRHRVPA